MRKLTRNYYVTVASLFIWAGSVFCGAQTTSTLDLDSSTEIKLTNGLVMRNCLFLQWNNDGMLVKYYGTTVPIKFAEIEPEQRKLFLDANAEAIKLFREETGLAIAPKHNGWVWMGPRRSIERNLESEAAAAERKRDEIKDGVSWHQLVVGMTQDEVRKTMGANPSSVSGKEGNEIWLYDLRGYNPDGLSAASQLCAKFLFFSHGKLSCWKY